MNFETVSDSKVILNVYRRREFTFLFITELLNIPGIASVKFNRTPEIAQGQENTSIKRSAETFFHQSVSLSVYRR